MTTKETKVIQTTEHAVTITYEDFCKAFDLPIDCYILHLTPGGPGWSAKSSTVDPISKFTATWAEKKVMTS